MPNILYIFYTFTAALVVWSWYKNSVIQIKCNMKISLSCIAQRRTDCQGIQVHGLTKQNNVDRLEMTKLIC